MGIKIGADSIGRYEEAIRGIPECFDYLTGSEVQQMSQDAADGKPHTTPLKEAQTFISAHFDMLTVWHDAIDALDSEIRADVVEGSIPEEARLYLKQQAVALFDATQLLLRAVAEYHHGVSGPRLAPEYGHAYALSNSALNPFN